MRSDEVIGIHLVCRRDLHVVDLGGGRFETRRWVLNREHLRNGHVYVALHEHRSEPSYRQGVLVGWAPDDLVPDRVVLTVQGTDTSLKWVGRGTGEKGLGRASEPNARRNASLTIRPQSYFGRVCWNSKGWLCPTGEARELEGEDSFVSKHHFGHEEWLLNNLYSLDGWRYGFLQPVNDRWEHHQGEVIDIELYTIDPKKRRLGVARLRRAEVLTVEQAREAQARFAERGLLDRMNQEVIAIGGDTSTLAGTGAGFPLFNIRFRPDDMEVLEPLEPYPPEHRVWTLNRYKLVASGAEESLPQKRNGTRQARPETFDPRSPVGPTAVEAIHNRIQNHLFRLLDKRFGDAVVYEQDHVDIVVDHPDLYAFIEVKSEPEARLALRSAIGQLLEYAWYQRGEQRRPELVVAAPAPLTPATRAFLERLKDREGLRIHYLAVTLETKDLAGLEGLVVKQRC